MDGLRGLSALYVLLHHAALMIPPQGLSGPSLTVRFLLRHGHAAVAVFIVLSGFCLMLPVVSGPPDPAPAGFFAFLKRRSRRILPPYLAALVGCWILIAVIPGFGDRERSPWDRALPAAGHGIVASHLFLVHNLSPRWISKIDPPMWSVATEWQIYLLFPVFVRLWRRLGISAAIGLGFSIGFGVAALAVPLKNPALRELCPWFAGLFTLGMAAALASRQRGHGLQRIDAGECRSPRLLTVGLGLAALGLGWAAVTGTNDPRFMIADPMVGIAVSCLLAHWARRAAPGPLAGSGTAGRPLPLLRVLEARWTVALGAFSYSLYLIHYPLLALVDSRLRHRAYEPDTRFWVLILMASPVILLAASLFHRVFERPFMRRTLKERDAMIPAGLRADRPAHPHPSGPREHREARGRPGRMARNDQA